MKSMSNSLYFSTKLLLFATPLLFNQAYATANWCGELRVLVAKSIYQKYELPIRTNVVLNRGDWGGCDELDTETGDCVNLNFEQVLFEYGPDIDIKFKERNGNKMAIIRVQQNYCFLEAGHITVEPKKGKFKYNITEGSYSSGRPGVVKITSIETPN